MSQKRKYNVRCVLMVVIALLTVIHGDDPCNIATQLGFLNQRLLGYVTVPPDVHLCDIYLADGWYSMGDYTLASSDRSCGTIHNWYMKVDKLPTAPGISDIVMCRNNGVGDKCSEEKTIQSSKCDDGTFVFNLVSLDECDDAYCIESFNTTLPSTVPSISFTPSVEATVLKVDGRRGTKHNALTFYCDFTPPSDTNYFYEVEWGLTTGLSLTTSIHVSDTLRFTNKDEFRKKTFLNEKHLESKALRIGITIACSIVAKSVLAGASSLAMISKPKFLGIEVLPKGTIKIKDKDEAKIKLQLTVPFGCNVDEDECFIDVNIFMPKQSDSCEIQSITSLKQREKKPCAVRIYNTDWNKPHEMKIIGTFGQNHAHLKTGYTIELVTQFKFSHHPFFRNYLVGAVRVELETDASKLNGKKCHSHNDPHMLSFDGLPYENQNSGTFILYRNTQYEVEVQIQTDNCYGSSLGSPYCNCGVVVAAGRDVFMVNKCKRTSWDINFKQCKDAILSRKVKQEAKSTYHVYLPTGTKVTIAIHGSFLNVDITPSMFDESNTEGLCGSFDYTRGNDKTIRTGSEEKDFNLSWKVESNEDLFESDNYKNLTPWSKEEHLCHCNTDDYLKTPDPIATCGETYTKTCDDNREKVSELNDQCALARRKRDADIHFTEETSFENKFQKDGYSNTFHKIYRRSVPDTTAYNKTTARHDCLHIMNTTVFQMCSNIPDLNLDPYVDNCVSDAMITNSMEWSLTHLEGLKGQCINELIVNQPLPPAILAEVAAGFNDSDSDINATSGTTKIPNLSTTAPVILESLLQDILAVSCPNECSGHGKCVNGSCICNHPFIDEDCSIDSNLPPIIKGIPDKGRCDLSLRKCEKTSVLGSNFVESASLRCKLIPYKVDGNTILSSGNILQQPATLRSIAEVSCPLPYERQRRAVDGTPTEDNYIARGYTVSISNDGRIFSVEDSIVIFDATCVNCSKIGGSIVCSSKDGYCMRKGKCYSVGESSGCETCYGDTAATVKWVSGLDCLVPSLPTEEPANLWIIAAVVVPVLVLLTIVGTVIYCKSKQKAKQKRSRQAMPNETFLTTMSPPSKQ